MNEAMNRGWLVTLLLIGGSALAQETPEAPESAAPSMPAPVSAALPEQAVAAADALAAAEDERASASDAEAGDASEEPSPANADQPVVASSGGTRTMSGMSILGNEEAPKSLVIVPWKSSEIGDGIGVSRSMNDRAIPVDREVFMREVRYYELRSGG